MNSGAVGGGLRKQGGAPRCRWCRVQRGRPEPPEADQLYVEPMHSGESHPSVGRSQLRNRFHKNSMAGE